MKNKREKVKKDGKAEGFIIELDGKSFRCECGANVFTKYEDIIDEWVTYCCNGCHREYEMQ